MKTSEPRLKLKAVLLLGAIPNQHNYVRMGLARLQQEFELTILDLNRLLGRESASGGLEPAFEVTPISSVEELEKTLVSLKPRFAIDFVGVDARAYLTICKTLAKVGTDLVVVKDGPVPSPGALKTLIRIAYGTLMTQLNPMKPISTNVDDSEAISGESGILDKMLMLAWGRIQRQIDIVGVFAGSKSFDVNSFFVKTRIWSASQDVHTFQIRDSTQRHESARDAIVFLDSPIADGLDWVALGRQPLVSADSYYASIRNVFAKIERATGKRVVVAGHPNHQNQSNFLELMGGRKVAFNSTPELTRISHSVLCHGSTSVSFAVLARKPLVFLSSNELSTTMYGAMLERMAKILKRPVVNIDSDLQGLDSALTEQVDSGAYMAYEDAYLKRTGANEARQWDSFIRFAREKYQDKK